MNKESVKKEVRKTVERMLQQPDIKVFDQIIHLAHYYLKQAFQYDVIQEIQGMAILKKNHTRSIRFINLMDKFLKNPLIKKQYQSLLQQFIPQIFYLLFQEYYRKQNSANIKSMKIHWKSWVSLLSNKCLELIRQMILNNLRVDINKGFSKKEIQDLKKYYENFGINPNLYSPSQQPMVEEPILTKKIKTQISSQHKNMNPMFSPNLMVNYPPKNTVYPQHLNNYGYYINNNNAYQPYYVNNTWEQNMLLSNSNMFMDKIRGVFEPGVNEKRMGYVPQGMHNYGVYGLPMMSNRHGYNYGPTRNMIQNNNNDFLITNSSIVSNNNFVNKDAENVFNVKQRNNKFQKSNKNGSYHDMSKKSNVNLVNQKSKTSKKKSRLSNSISSISLQQNQSKNRFLNSTEINLKICLMCGLRIGIENYKRHVENHFENNREKYEKKKINLKQFRMRNQFWDETDWVQSIEKNQQVQIVCEAGLQQSICNICKEDFKLKWSKKFEKWINPKTIWGQVDENMVKMHYDCYIAILKPDKIQNLTFCYSKNS